jgi:hypothetical protein
MNALTAPPNGPQAALNNPSCSSGALHAETLRTLGRDEL